MKILGIETSTMMGGIAVLDDSEGIVCEARASLKAAYSERLIPMLDSMLRTSGLTLNDLSAIAVSTGPGSFTGLRVGIGTAKGLAYATGLPVVSVPTLEVLASGVSSPGMAVCTVLDARKNEVYAAVFKYQDDGLVRLMSDCAIAPDALAKLLSTYDGIFLIGDGAIKYRQIFKELCEGCIIGGELHASPQPASVSFLGMIKLKAGLVTDPANIMPYYVRKSEAETKSGL